MVLVTLISLVIKLQTRSVEKLASFSQVSEPTLHTKPPHDFRINTVEDMKVQLVA